MKDKYKVLFPSKPLLQGDSQDFSKELKEIQNLIISKNVKNIEFKIDVFEFYHSKAPFLKVDEFLKGVDHVYNKFYHVLDSLMFNISLDNLKIRDSNILSIRLIESFIRNKGVFANNVKLNLIIKKENKDLLDIYLSSLEDFDTLKFNKNISVDLY